MSHTVYVVYVQVFYIAFVYRNVPRTLNHGHSPPPDNRPRTEASPDNRRRTRALPLGQVPPPNNVYV